MAINQTADIPDRRNPGNQARDTSFLVLDTDGTAAAHARDILAKAGFPHVMLRSDTAGIADQISTGQQNPLIIITDLHFLEATDLLATVAAGRTTRTSR